MTQEDKELLLKDLSARIPYGVMIQIPELFYPQRKIIEKLVTINDLWYFNDDGIYIENVKPYLRPMSSMTEEEMDKLAEFHIWNDGEKIFPDCNCKLSDIVSAMNWLSKKMFDYRRLIEKGLALEAPENMYK